MAGLAVAGLAVAGLAAAGLVAAGLRAVYLRGAADLAGGPEAWLAAGLSRNRRPADVCL